MTNPAFIVEGHLEKAFLEKICPGRTVRKLEVNGRDVALDAIIKRVETLSILFHGKHYPIVVVFDREGRGQSAIEIAKIVRDGLAKKLPSDTFVVGVADRMTENWILADWATLAQTIQDLPAIPPSNVEGGNGKALLRSLLKDKKYSATIDGPRLLVQAKAHAIAQGSTSFEALRAQLSFGCAWLSS